MNPDPTFSPEAKSQLARLYNAVLTGGAFESRLLRHLGLDRDIATDPLRQFGYDQVGVPATRLYGLLTDPNVRVVGATQLPRVVRACVSRGEIGGAIQIEDLVFDPPLGE